MQPITETEILEKLSFDNPWWDPASSGIEPRFRSLGFRAYAPSFIRLVRNRDVNRAVILMGPRRVGKTVMVYHAIQDLLDSGVPGKNIVYISMETPVFTGRSLARLVDIFLRNHDHKRDDALYVFFDEIQYLREWERHLKNLVDTFPAFKFVATGSAAAALKLKSMESGAGRFTEFLLPPLTFFEFLEFRHVHDSLIVSPAKASEPYATTDIELLNKEFVDYINIGGYPEAVINQEVRQEAGRYIRSDIIEKVLLRDLPQLYGIQNIQDLNQLFNLVAYNTGREFNLESLSSESDIPKNTLRKFLEYLEAAFLIKRLDRVDSNAKNFKRARTFKLYLTNASMRSALFAPVSEQSPGVGELVETAIFGQWVHSPRIIGNLRYARWDGKREVDLVNLDPLKQKAQWAVEVKWSDRPARNDSEYSALLELARKAKLKEPSILVTTRTISDTRTVNGINVRLIPSSLYCYTVGRNTENRNEQFSPIPHG